MYNLLVVDDEEIAVKGIVHGIDWSDMPLENIFVAYDVNEAKQCFEKHHIHLLLSDIDMPDNNGIELLNWVREQSKQTETIFLTGHADFKYAQQAVQLDSFDYLLKPVDHNHLKKTLQGAIDRIKKNEEITQFMSTYEHYYKLWNNQLPLLSERLWQDIINMRMMMTPKHLDSAFKLYDIPLNSTDHIQLIMISIEQWSEPFSARDEEIMTYAVKNASEELILQDLHGQVIQDVSGILYAILYHPQQDMADQLKANCSKFIEKCKDYLHCSISCYIGNPVSILQVYDSTAELVGIERDCLSSGEMVVFQSNYKKEPFVGGIQLNFQDWSVLLELGKKSEISRRIEENFSQMEGNTDILFLEGYYHGVVYMVFQTLLKKSISIDHVYSHNEWRDVNSILRSHLSMKEWVLKFINKAIMYIQDHSKEYSSAVQKVIQYIEDHIDEDFNRESIAKQVFLNSAYLSRVFKKETGCSLFDYILKVRIDKVKPLLEKTNDKISDIAQSVGYTNFSYFTKMFRKVTGLTPHEYRRKYQKI